MRKLMITLRAIIKVFKNLFLCTIFSGSCFPLSAWEAKPHSKNQDLI